MCQGCTTVALGACKGGRTTTMGGGERRAGEGAGARSAGAAGGRTVGTARGGAIVGPVGSRGPRLEAAVGEGTGWRGDGRVDGGSEGGGRDQSRPMECFGCLVAGRTLLRWGRRGTNKLGGRNLGWGREFVKQDARDAPGRDGKPQRQGPGRGRRHGHARGRRRRHGTPSGGARDPSGLTCSDTCSSVVGLHPRPPDCVGVPWASR